MADTPTTTMPKRIVLGSGKVFVIELPDTFSTADPEALITTYAIDANEFGAIKNGATLTYTPTTYTVQDDLGRFVKTIITSEAVTLGCGLITIGGNTFNVLVDTARVSTSSTTGAQIIKIGGTGNSKNKTYLIIFQHIDPKDGDIYVIITGKNTAELQFTLQPGSETILNPTFTAEAADDDGTKVIIVMEKPKTVATTPPSGN